MADIQHHFPIAAPVEAVFRAVSDPSGLDQWWTLRSEGEPTDGAAYTLDFGPEHVWKAHVTLCLPDQAFELALTDAHPDWQDTVVRFDLAKQDGATGVRFRHSGWPAENDHYFTSCYCWAMYLRVMKRWLEHGETVPYEKRLDV